MRSKLLLGSTAGFAGALVIALLIFMLKPFGIEVKLISAISQLFIVDSLLGSSQATVVGLLAHLICGSIVGTVFFLGLEVTGFNHWTLKGAFMGVVVWFLLCGVLARILNLNIQSNAINSLSTLLVHIIHGIVTSWVIVYFYDKAKI